jgi:hypothetical protein
MGWKWDILEIKCRDNQKHPLPRSLSANKGAVIVRSEAAKQSPFDWKIATRLRTALTMTSIQGLVRSMQMFSGNAMGAYGYQAGVALMVRLDDMRFSCLDILSKAWRF